MENASSLIDAAQIVRFAVQPLAHRWITPAVAISNTIFRLTDMIFVIVEDILQFTDNEPLFDCNLMEIFKSLK